jgi:hypothetical protein
MAREGIMVILGGEEVTPEGAKRKSHSKICDIHNINSSETNTPRKNREFDNV